MAQLTAKEFDDLITVLANHLRFDRLHERLLKANALVSRKRPATPHALAAQLYQLSAGLRRAHPARYAVEVLWQEMLSAQVTDDHTKTLEHLADRVNACLTPRMEVIPERSEELRAALGAYHQAVAAFTDDTVAYLEVLLRASTDVAQFVREHKETIMATETAPPPETESGEQDPGSEHQSTEQKG